MYIESLKLLHWNINQRYAYNTPTFVADEIIKYKAHIVVLTEFNKTTNYYDDLVKRIEDSEYRVFIDSRPRKEKIRQVLIAIHKELINNQPVKITELPDNENNIDNGKFPNFMRVDFNYCNQPITIIGTRIRIKKSSGKEEQLRRRKQFKTLMNFIPEDRGIIILGDFNISDQGAFKSPTSEWHFDKHYKNELNQRGLEVKIPKGEICSPVDTGLKMDHLIINKIINVKKYPYYEDRNLGEGNNVPDHAILIAEVGITG